MQHTKMYSMGLCLVALLATAMVGCGDGKLATEGVSGVVTLDGVPTAGITVNFSPAKSGEGTPSYGLTNEKGEYKLQTLLGNADAGTTPGEYIVTFTKREAFETGKTVTNSDGTTAPEMSAKETLPDKYTDSKKSEQKATVVAGSNTFNFDLTTK